MYICKAMRVRIAPTPSGYLHIGNIYNFILNWLWARVNGGEVLLRIDDLDTTRVKDNYIEDIFRVLEWLNVDWDLGPQSVADFETHWSQKNRQNLYIQELEKLRHDNLLFACDCSRKTVQKSGRKYPDICIYKNLNFDTPKVAWKLKLGDTPTIQFYDDELGAVIIDVAACCGNFALRRNDAIPAYQIASLVDDMHFEITHICRGKDLLNSTAMQLCLANYLYIQTFKNIAFWHHSLVLNEAGEKMSKSAGISKTSITNFVSKEKIFNGFAEWMKWPVVADSLADTLSIARQDERFKI
jgi:glutamyl-tRNA synthetase